MVKRMHGIDFPDEVIHGLWLAQHVRLQAFHSHTHLPKAGFAGSQGLPGPQHRDNILLPTQATDLASDLLIWVDELATRAWAYILSVT
jgi:hypothetical protein